VFCHLTVKQFIAPEGVNHFNRCSVLLLIVAFGFALCRAKPLDAELVAICLPMAGKSCCGLMQKLESSSVTLRGPGHDKSAWHLVCVGTYRVTRYRLFTFLLFAILSGYNKVVIGCWGNLQIKFIAPEGSLPT